jgi:hypothetical protein
MTKHEDPFPHWTWDEFPAMVGISPALVASESLAHRANHRGEWVHYANDCERNKSACNKVYGIGPATKRLYERLRSPFVVAHLSAVTGVRPLEADPTLHGAGIHALDGGGWLNPHVDYAAHPVRPEYERRVNLLVFLTDSDPKEGGAFELWDSGGFQCVKRIYPRAGSAVAWCPGDTEFHATQRLADNAFPRLTAAAYFLAPIRPTAVRRRALFVPHRG